MGRPLQQVKPKCSWFDDLAISGVIKIVKVGSEQSQNELMQTGEFRNIFRDGHTNDSQKKNFSVHTQMYLLLY